MCMYIYTRADHVCTTYVHKHTHTHIYIHAYIHTHTYTRAHTYTQTHTHTIITKYKITHNAVKFS